MRKLNLISFPDPWVPFRQYLDARVIATYSAFASGTTVLANNDAHYVPIVFPSNATLYAIRFAGSSATGNYDLGLYDEGLTRLASKGSTAMSNAVQELSLPDLRVKSGELYYAALSLSDATATIYRMLVGGSTLLHTIGWGFEASALPLPATATPVSNAAYLTLPLFAFGIR